MYLSLQGGYDNSILYQLVKKENNTGIRRIVAFTLSVKPELSWR